MQLDLHDRLALTSTPRDLGDRYLDFLCAVLLGYALFNRSFAYVGVSPLFVGEISLVLGVMAWLLHPVISPLGMMASPWLLLSLMGWVALRTAPYLGHYGLDSVRDAMFLGYGTFAFIVAGLVLARPARLLQLLHRYRQFCYLFLLLTPLIRMSVIAVGGEDNLPRLPGSRIPLVCLRMGPVMIHLASVTVFLSARRVSKFWLGMIALNFVLAMTSRGGTLAFLVTISMVMVLRPTTRAVWHLIALALFCVAILGLSGIEIKLDSAHSHRNISFNMLREQLSSIGGSSHEGSFDDTKEWRLTWWKRILEYTLDGPYFWSGKGFGINLALDDGVPQAEDDVPLRSPHNSHLTLLARGGLPALLVWVGLNGCWVLGIMAHYSIACRRGNGRWAELFLFLLAHWTAAMVSTSFDVYLEGPMGGIWFWTIFGVGWASGWLHLHRNELLASSTVATSRVLSGNVAPNVVPADIRSNPTRSVLD